MLRPIGPRWVIRSTFATCQHLVDVLFPAVPPELAKRVELGLAYPVEATTDRRTAPVRAAAGG